MYLGGCFLFNVVCLLFARVGAENNFFSYTVTDITGKVVDLSMYAGKVSLVVNVASECGYTDNHYRALVRLQDQLAMTKKFNVLAFPCNQFGAQEPKSNAEISKFAANTYRVNFPMFSKINVIEEQVSPPWQYLVAASDQVPTWNFWKYLVDHEGKVLEAWGPWTEVHAIVPEVHQAVDKAVAASLSNKQTEHAREDL